MRKACRFLTFWLGFALLVQGALAACDRAESNSNVSGDLQPTQRVPQAEGSPKGEPSVPPAVPESRTEVAVKDSGATTKAAKHTPEPGSPPGASGPSGPSGPCEQPTPKTACEGEFCRIEPGCYTIGAPRSEFGVARYSDRQARVTLTRAFEIGRTEVTRAQWMAAGLPLPAQPRLAGTAECREPDCPVASINFYEALAFANRLSESQGLGACYSLSECTGSIGVDYRCVTAAFVGGDIYACNGFRLPTEAEWEYAARAGTDGAFYTGDIVPRDDFSCVLEPALEEIAWYCANSDGRAHSVGGKAPNGWGLSDMLGNVFEWCSDNYDESGYGAGPLVDPVFVRPPTSTVDTPGPDVMRVARGGNHVSPPVNAKASKRLAVVSFAADTGIGLRLARSLPGKPGSTE